jgi:cell wall-associated NlpC family hydrolase
MTDPHEAYSAAAVAWALARVAERVTPGRCLAFVEDAYERANSIEVFGGDTAAESAAAYGTRPYDAQRPPPAGAFVFYACGGPIGGVTREWGHVGLAIGDGRVVHALDEVRVDDALAFETLSLGRGWSAPRLMGWTGAERILEGHTRRTWTPAADG